VSENKKGERTRFRQRGERGFHLWYKQGRVRERELDFKKKSEIRRCRVK
jgi:hypothetical protein